VRLGKSREGRSNIGRAGSDAQVLHGTGTRASYPPALHEPTARQRRRVDDGGQKEALDRALAPFPLLVPPF
jgi:hypothetical protein